MACYPRCIAPALLASFVGLIATAAAHAEPASAASPADADCLAKPSGQTAPGNHWYYRLDRASGRRCWYQRPESGAPRSAQNDAAPSRSVPARAAASPPSGTAASDGAADTASGSRDQRTSEAAPAAPAQPFGWSTAAPAPAPPEPMMVPASEGVAPAPEPAALPSATADAPASVGPPAAPPSRAPLRDASVERPAAPVEIEAGTHTPALLGAALALLIVVLGSIVARSAASLIRSRRRDRALAAATTTPPMFSAQDAPALVPAMPRERDVARTRRVPRLPRNAPPERQERAQDRTQERTQDRAAGDPAERIRADARALEQDVRDLLRRMRSDLLDQRPAPAAPAAPQPTAAQELDLMLARLRERRRKQA